MKLLILFVIVFAICVTALDRYVFGDPALVSP